MAAIHAEPTAHAAGFSALDAADRCLVQRAGAFRAVRRANRTGRLALPTADLARDLFPFQVGLEVPGGEVALVDVFRQVDLQQLPEPTVRALETALRVVQLRLQ